MYNVQCNYGVQFQLTELSLHHGTADGQPFARLELGGQGEEPLVLHVQLVVHLAHDEDLRPPVLGVRGTVLQP